MHKFKQNTQKFKELILYISEKCATDPNFGATKLNKILFLSDFWAYARFKKPITGVEYMKLPKGPAPRPLFPIREEMVGDGELAIQETAITEEISRKRPINLRSADLSVFDAQEIALVDQIVTMCSGVTAVRMSNYTHNWHGWIAARDQETIPYETVFISDDPITPFEIERGRELAKQYGWAV
ncbi:MAG: Panacea domain-containing protein [Acidobacteriaceae bacterium]